jgi:DNA gyrase inhibitor GyrI
MRLTENPDVVTWPETVYCYVEKVGPFQNGARAAWEELQRALPKLADQAKLTHRFFARYDPEASIYRAGVSLSAPLSQPPLPLRCETYPGGRFARFVLEGSYANLGAASGRVFERVRELRLERRSDFCIESYVNDPKVTPEDKLITEILIPVA